MLSYLTVVPVSLLLLKSTNEVNGLPIPAPQGVIYAAAPAHRGAFHVGGNGVYNYGYNTGDGIAKVEVRHSDGSVTGSYRYFDPSGRQIVRSYVADNLGFRVLGNDLPVAPDTPAIGVLEAQTLTGAVEGTNKFSVPNVVALDRTPLVFQDSTDLILQTPVNVNRQSITQPRFRSRTDDTGNEYWKMKNRNENNLVDTRYFYASENIPYDFPAGFAYNAEPVVARLSPIGVKGEESKQPVAAGHTNGRSGKKHSIQHVRSSPGVSSRTKFTIGHAK